MDRRIPHQGPGAIRRKRLGHQQRTADGYWWQTTAVNRRAGIINVKCTGQKGMECNVTARCYLNDENRFEYQNNAANHTHPNDPQMPRILTCWNALYNAVTTSIISTRQIYQEVMTTFLDVQGEIIYDEIKETLRRWRNNAEYPAIDGYAGFQRTIEANPWSAMLRLNQGIMRVNTVNAPDQRLALVIGDPSIPAFIEDLSKIHISTLPKVQPMMPTISDVLAVTAEVQNRAVTFAWVFYAHLSQDLVNEIFLHIKMEYFGGRTPNSVYTNFDDKLRTGVQVTWPDCQVKSTYHNVALTIFHRAKNTEGINLDNNDHLIVIQKLVSLALLPSQNITDTFFQLYGALDEEASRIFNPLFVWYHDAILIDAESLSFHGDVTGFHVLEMKNGEKLLHWCNSRQPDTWTTYRACARIAQSSKKDLMTLLVGTPKQKRNISMTPKLSPYMSTRRLSHSWHMLTRGDTTPTRFIAAMCHQFGRYFALLIYNHHYDRGLYQMVAPGEQNNHLEIDDARVPRNPRELLMVLNWAQFVAEEEEAVAENGEGGLEPENDQEQLVVVPDPPIRYDHRCLLCEQRPVKFIAGPCNCVVFCEQCSGDIQTGNQIMMCPNCGQRVRTVQRVFIEEQELAVNEGNDPYDWQCLVCFGMTPASWMGEQCRHLIYCRACAQLINNRAARQGELPTCAKCRGQNALIEVTIRQLQG